jgi:ubiquinone/menaquinone biosynthesis C-methylase UbiE
MRLFRKSPLENLAVAMAGVKLGDRVLVAGCSDPLLIAALAAKTGLTGRACAADKSVARTAEAARVAQAEGALIETFAAPLTALPFDEASFDIVVLRDVLVDAAADARLRTAKEAWRMLRPGGRCIAIQSIPRRGLARMLRARSSARGETAATTSAMQDAQFRGVRTLAEREGLAFVEGVKPVSISPS